MTADQQSADVARERALLLADQDLQAIALLLESPGWLYLQRRLNETRNLIRDRIADDETLSDLDTRILRAKSATLSEVLRIPATDRAVHQTTLANARVQESGPRRG